jgi:cytochrome c-type biogenesis protein CcmH/NrfF
MAMNCWACDTELIWGGDHDLDTDEEEEKHHIVTNLHCPKCDSFALVYWGK